MIIDAHVHILPQRRLDGLSIWLGKEFASHPLAGKRFTVEKILQELSRNGVTHVFNSVFPMKANETEELNLFNYHLSKKFTRIIPFGSLHIENQDKKRIVDRCVHEYGFLGFKLHPYVQEFSPDDERLFPAYERMEDLSKPINIHTGFEDYYPKVEKRITLSAMEGLVKKFSSLMYIIPHMFYPRLSEAVYLMENYENVYLDTTNIFSAILQDEKRGVNRDRERDILMETLKKWSKRMFFGTDHPAGMSDVDTIFSDFYSFNLPNKIKQDLLHDSAYQFAERYGYFKQQ
jgi:predicted TIM-barrel fold metal-dependent hydrolase